MKNLKCKIIFVGIMGVILGGCHPRELAGWDVQTSKANYKECLQAYPNDATKCEGLRKLFEVDQSAIESMRGNNATVKVQNR